MSSVKITKIGGKARVLRNLDRISSAIPHNLRQGLEESVIYLRDKAIENLVTNSLNPFLSIDGESIAEKDNWIFKREEELKVSLECTSKHAAVVEFGDTVLRQGKRKFIAREHKGYRGWPIGRQQGAGDYWYYSFTIQKPKWYLTSAINSSHVRENMKNIIESHLDKSFKVI